ncbi:hypothetical protein J3R83DRAFT_3970 [Lanmaoa asiatica]|nr:hypothetical protein J3R83DRAFT_3970 [Lanmaoa asiatica]
MSASTENLSLSRPICTPFSSLNHPATVVSSPPTSNLNLCPSSSPHRVDVDTGLGFPYSQKPTQKHTQLEFSLPSEEVDIPQAAWNPCKKFKTVYTAVGAVFAVVCTLIDGCHMQVSISQKTRELEDLCSLHLLQLARASRSTLAAHMTYRCLHLQEIEVMCTIAIDECEEAEVCLRRADKQIGEIRNVLHTNGTVLGDSSITLFDAAHARGDNESSLQTEESDYKSQTSSVCDDNM